MISYYWPPAGGVSVLRTLKIAKYLRAFGWEPIIYTTSNASYPYIDEGNLQDVPEGINVVKRPIVEPFDLFKKLSGRKKDERLDNILQVRSKNSNFFEHIGIWVRANFFIPDARSLWISPSVRYLKRFLKENPVDAVFSDGPPHTNTVIARKVSQYFKIPWLADFQDPWTQADYYEMFPISRIADRIHRAMERKVFQEADKITIASPTWKKDLERIGANKVDVIFYGYDESDFEGIEKQKDKEKLILSHAGLFGNDRFPDAFFKAIADIVKKEPALLRRIVINLIGQVDWSVKDTLKELGLEPIVHYEGFIPRKKVLQSNAQADLLLLPLNKASNAKGRLPGKLYEYLRSGTPVLAFGPTDSDASAILEDTGCGTTIEYGDYDASISLLQKLIGNGTLTGFEPKGVKISAFSNRNQTKKIAEFLDTISNQAPQGKPRGFNDNSETSLRDEPQNI